MISTRMVSGWVLFGAAAAMAAGLIIQRVWLAAAAGYGKDLLLAAWAALAGVAAPVGCEVQAAMAGSRARSARAGSFLVFMLSFWCDGCGCGCGRLFYVGIRSCGKKGLKRYNQYSCGLQDENGLKPAWILVACFFCIAADCLVLSCLVLTSLALA